MMARFCEKNALRRETCSQRSEVQRGPALCMIASGPDGPGLVYRGEGVGSGGVAGARVVTHGLGPGRRWPTDGSRPGHGARVPDIDFVVAGA